MSKVLLIGWDAADWKVIRPLIDAGEMPNIARLVRTGASASIATLQPSFSPMLWTSIATGKRPFDHGIHGFSEPRPDGRDIQRISNLSRKCKAVWNILGQSGLRSIVVGWWPAIPPNPFAASWFRISSTGSPANSSQSPEWCTPRISPNRLPNCASSPNTSPPT